MQTQTRKRIMEAKGTIGNQNQGLDLEKELTCSICTEVLYQPLTLLDCLHTFCGSCLKEWFSFQAAAHSAPEYTCPSCRATVRDTKHNATVTTLLDMFLAANPDKGRSDEEREEMGRKYKLGDEVLVRGEEKSLRERREEDEDRRLVDRVRETSLRDVGMSVVAEGRRERRLRASSRDVSRESRSGGDGRERRRRRARDDSDRTLQPEGPGDERRRRRSNEERRTTRNEESSRTAARQIEHQSSLRSLISSSDVDSREMEEEILRQIREEGLLDGIDLENIDVSQEDQISERIAEAFRRRQAERARGETTRRAPRREEAPRPTPGSRDTSGDDKPINSSRRTTHSRTSSAVSTGDGTSRPPQSMSAIQAAHLEVQSSDEGRHRRRRTTSSSRSSTTPVPVADPEARPATRSSTDLGERRHSMHLPGTRSVSAHPRSTTDPAVRQAAELPVPESRERPQTAQQSESESRRAELPASDTRNRQSVELPASEPAPRQPQTTPKSSPRLRSTAQMEDISTQRKPRAGPPADISVTSLNLPSGPQLPGNRSLVPAPLSPRPIPGQIPTLADRAAALSSGSRPTSSSSATEPKHPQKFYPEPSISCNRCQKPHIEYTLHYNCGICSDGTYNICLSCYRAGKGCLHWFGFGQAAWNKWERLIHSSPKSPVENPHMLKASRYIPPRAAPGGADGRRTLTTDDPEKRLQSGTFCTNCLAWTNECYWRCNLCNDGDWGFCNPCVNQGKSCTHPLLPLTYKPSEEYAPPLSPTQDQRTPVEASILTGPNVVSFGNFKPLTFSTKCDICRYPISPTASRFHCFECTSKVPGTLPGDYDICTGCYEKLAQSRRISEANGARGWRRCLKGHRMAIVGFEDGRMGRRRIVVSDLVGGRGIRVQPHTYEGGEVNGDLMKWSWGDGIHIRGDDSHFKIVTRDVMKAPPLPLSLEGGGRVEEKASSFPPNGGVGMIGVALWSWFPEEGADDELMFPRGAVVTECKDANGDWWYGVYMGRKGLFPSNHLRVLDRGPS